MKAILVPGFWLDATSWRAVLPPLEAAGIQAMPITPAGMDAPPAQRRTTTLADQIAALVELIDATDGDLVLVGHSGGGSIIYGAIDARPERITRGIYVDSGPGGEGFVINSELPSVEGEIPLDWSRFDDADLAGLDDATRQRVRGAAIPEPEHVARDPLHVANEKRLDVPATVICCTLSAADMARMMDPEHDWHSYVRELTLIRDVEFVDLPTGHWPQFSRPEELGSAIAAAITR